MESTRPHGCRASHSLIVSAAIGEQATWLLAVPIPITFLGLANVLNPLDNPVFHAKSVSQIGNWLPISAPKSETNFRFGRMPNAAAAPRTNPDRKPISVSAEPAGGGSSAITA